MSRLIFHIFLAYISLNPYLVLAQNDIESRPPALVLRINREAIDLSSEFIAKLIQPMALSAKIPSTNLTISYTKIDLKNFSVKTFAQPTIKYELIGPNKISLDIIAGPVLVCGDWHAEKPTLITTQIDQGGLDFKMQEFKATMIAEFGKPHANGLPSLTMPTCTAQLGKASLNVRDAKQKFFIDILQTFSLVFRKLAQSQLCSVIQSIVSSEINNRIKSIPDMLSGGHGIGAKYSLQPSVTHDYIEISLRAALVSPPIDQAHQHLATATSSPGALASVKPAPAGVSPPVSVPAINTQRPQVINVAPVDPANVIVNVVSAGPGAAGTPASSARPTASSATPTPRVVAKPAASQSSGWFWG